MRIALASLADHTTTNPHICNMKIDKLNDRDFVQFMRKHCDGWKHRRVLKVDWDALDRLINLTKPGNGGGNTGLLQDEISELRSKLEQERAEADSQIAAYEAGMSELQAQVETATSDLNEMRNERDQAVERATAYYELSQPVEPDDSSGAIDGAQVDQVDESQVDDSQVDSSDDSELIKESIDQGITEGESFESLGLSENLIELLEDDSNGPSFQHPQELREWLSGQDDPQAALAKGKSGIGPKFAEDIVELLG